PGPMFNTIGEVDGVDLIRITGTQVYPTTGELNLTTVTERGGPYGELTLPEAFTGWVSNQDVVVPTTDLFPEGTTEQDATDEGAANFANSQSNAISAALTYLDIPVTSSVVIAFVTANSPATGKLKVGDVIEAVDGVPVKRPEDLPPLIRAKAPGSTVTFSIKRNQAPATEVVELGANPRDPLQGYVGVASSNEYSGPFPIEFGVQGVGGPSAGTMFALGIVDKLTPGDLTGGHVVAGTGTVNPAGEVGSIGGIQQKMFAANNNGAKLFLAPRENCASVLAAAPPELNVVAVSTLTEAVETLKAWKSGSTDLPRC
ncbi:MAG: PDZ domain-containing protein, partial [Candidatus Nanopelagicales bacterium]